MTSALKLTLRQRPHLDWISTGWAGLLTDPETSQAKIEGTVEVRLGGSGNQSRVYTQWLKVELKKTETVVTSKGLRRYFELIGSKEQILWSGKGQTNADKDGFAPIDTSDHAFSIPVPAGLPPSISIDKGKDTGIVYHLVASAYVKPRAKSLFGSSSSSNSFKPPTTISSISEVTIEKHELNPTWPVYSWQAEQENLQIKQANLCMKLKRETVVFGGGDAMKFTVNIFSERTAPVKITRLELTVREVIITRERDEAGNNSNDPRRALQQINEIVNLKTPAHNLLYQNESTSHTLSTTFPSTQARYTVQNAKHLEVKYQLKLRAIIEVPKEAKAKKGDSIKAQEEAVKELVLDNVPVLISPWGKKSGEYWKGKVGQTPRNLERPAPKAVQSVPANTAPASSSPALPNASIGSQTSAPMQNAVNSATANAPSPARVFVPISAPPVPPTPAYQERRLSMPASISPPLQQIPQPQRRLSTLQPTTPKSIPYAGTAPIPYGPPALSTIGASQSASSLPLHQSQNNIGQAITGSPLVQTQSAPQAPVSASAAPVQAGSNPMLGGNGRTIPAAVFTGRHLSSFRPYSPQFMVLREQHEQQQRQNGESDAPSRQLQNSQPAAPQQQQSQTTLYQPQPQHTVSPAHIRTPSMSSTAGTRGLSSSMPPSSSNGGSYPSPAALLAAKRPLSASPPPKAWVPPPIPQQPTSAQQKQQSQQQQQQGGGYHIRQSSTSPPLRYSTSDQGHGSSNYNNSFTRSVGGNGNAPTRSQTRAGVMSWHGHASQMQSFRVSPPPPLQMDGAYPSIVRSASQSHPLANIPDIGGRRGQAFPASMSSPDLTSVREATDVNEDPSRNRSETPPDRRRYSTPSVSALPMVAPRRRDSLTPTRYDDEQEELQLHPIGVPLDRQRGASDNGISAMPTRKNTMLSTITASPPSSAPTSPDEVSKTVPLPSVQQRQWDSAEQEKERLFTEAVERARRTQEEAAAYRQAEREASPESEYSGDQRDAEEEQLGLRTEHDCWQRQESDELKATPGVGEMPSTNANGYKSVTERSPTPLMMRSMSNPGPIRQKSRDYLSIDAAFAPSGSANGNDTELSDNRMSVYSGHLPYLSSQSADGHGQSVEQYEQHNRDYSYGTQSLDGHDTTPYRQQQDLEPERDEGENSFSRPPPVPENHRPHNRLASDSSHRSNDSRISSSSTLQSSLDQQKIAYLKALSAREAYQSRKTGAQPMPLSALEEKERLKKQYEEEELRSANGEHGDMSNESLEGLSNGFIGNQSNVSINLPEEEERQRPEQHSRQPFPPSSAALYSPGSVYLTPGTSYATPGNPSGFFFETPNSSSSHLPSTSEQSQSSVSLGYHRNPAIALGKQRRTSTYVEQENNDNGNSQALIGSGGNGGSSNGSSSQQSHYQQQHNNIVDDHSTPPARPPKPLEVVRDQYSHLDTPVSPGAAEYERQFFFRQSLSDYGH